MIYFGQVRCEGERGHRLDARIKAESFHRFVHDSLMRSSVVVSRLSPAPWAVILVSKPNPLQ